MNYVVVEIFIYMTWAAVFVTRLRRSSPSATEELQVLLFALPTAMLVEVVNEYLYAGAGLYYPSSLLYFPMFKFPVALIFSGTLYTWGFYVLSRRIAIRIAGEDSRFLGLLQLGLFLLLLSTNVLVEPIGISIGYWQWHKPPPETFAMYAARYMTYFEGAFPPALFAAFFSWRSKIGVKARPPSG
jgi:hypothetical protein